MSIMSIWKPAEKRNDSSAGFVVVHPLDDKSETKIDISTIGRMKMTSSVKISLIALRGHLILMVVMVIFHVLDLAGAFGRIGR
jgi:hypothetical protein